MLPSWEVIIHDASLLLSPQGSLTVAPFLGAPRRLSFTMPPFLPSPQISLSDAPFLGAQRGNQSPLLLVGIGSCLGTDPRALPYPVAIPGKLVRPSNESSQGVAIWRVGTPSEREPGILSGGMSPCSSRGSFAPAWPNHQSCGSSGHCGWNLAEASRNDAETSTQETKHHTRRVGELKFIMLMGPEKLTL